MKLNDLISIVKDVMSVHTLEDAIAIHKKWKSIPMDEEYDEEAEDYEVLMAQIVYEYNQEQLFEIANLVIDGIKEVKDERTIVGLVILLDEIGEIPIVDMSRKEFRKWCARRGSAINWFNQTYPRYVGLA
jgi:hypothetical protein